MKNPRKRLHRKLLCSLCIPVQREREQRAFYHAVQPPSTVMDVPVTKEDASLSR